MRLRQAGSSLVPQTRSEGGEFWQNHLISDLTYLVTGQTLSRSILNIVLSSTQRPSFPACLILTRSHSLNLELITAALMSCISALARTRLILQPIIQSRARRFIHDTCPNHVKRSTKPTEGPALDIYNKNRIRSGKKKGGRPAKKLGDKSRVNIVNGDLCGMTHLSIVQILRVSNSIQMMSCIGWLHPYKIILAVT
jgi:hypothetical protein